MGMRHTATCPLRPGSVCAYGAGCSVNLHRQQRHVEAPCKTVHSRPPLGGQRSDRNACTGTTACTVTTSGCFDSAVAGWFADDPGPCRCVRGARLCGYPTYAIRSWVSTRQRLAAVSDCPSSSAKLEILRPKVIRRLLLLHAAWCVKRASTCSRLQPDRPRLGLQRRLAPISVTRERRQLASIPPRRCSEPPAYSQLGIDSGYSTRAQLTIQISGPRCAHGPAADRVRLNRRPAHLSARHGRSGVDARVVRR